MCFILNTPTCITIGNLYSLAKRSDLAMRQFKTNSQSSYNPIGLIAMGKEQLSLGDFRQALDYFTRPWRADPKKFGGNTMRLC